MSAATTYLGTFDELRRRKRWTTDTTVLRFAAMTLASVRLDDLGQRLEETAKVLRAEAGWFDPLRSAIRYAVAAMILRRGRDPREVAQQVAATRESFREQRLPRGGVSQTIAALLLVLHGAGPAAAGRVKTILARWRADHPWLTGADDLPMAALHAARDVPAETLGAAVERVYERLRAAGFSRGNPLQLASHLLVVDPRGADGAASRFVLVADALRGHGERVGSSRYDEMALIALTTTPVPAIIERILGWRDELRAARPRPAREIAFSLACGLALAEETERAITLRGAQDASALAALKAVLDAQQAAATAACSAAIAASAASAAA